MRQRRRKADGEALAALREDAWLSQMELAEMAGVSRTTISDIESGKNSHPRKATLFALAGALGVRPESLLEERKGPGPLVREARERGRRRAGVGAYTVLKR